MDRRKWKAMESAYKLQQYCRFDVNTMCASRTSTAAEILPM